MKNQIVKLSLIIWLPFITAIAISDFINQEWWYFVISIVSWYCTIACIYYIHYEQGLIKFGTTRVVYLIGPYAFKFPTLYSWTHFIQGLLGNIQERMFARHINLRGKLCPVYFSVWGGFLNIMPRCNPLDEKSLPHWWDFEEWSESTILENDDLYVTVEGLPVENKLSSFGILNGNIVAIDFGSWDRVTYKIKEE